jgi:hypothetical protein
MCVSVYHQLGIVGIALVLFSASGAFVEADTLHISNTVSNSVSTGGNSSRDGQSGQDGADGQPGQDGADGQAGQSVITVGAESYTTQIVTDVNGTTTYFYDSNSTSTTQSAATSSKPDGTASSSAADLRTTLLHLLRELLTSYVNALR